jgi:hypothetical protein
MFRRVLLLAAAVAALSFAVTASAQASGWSVKATPTIAGADDVVLNGVSCANGGACVAVGSYLNPQGTIRPLSETWDGHSWTQQKVPTPVTQNSNVPTRGQLFGVSCTAANACTAVGTFLNFPNLDGGLLVERWDGSHWTRQTAATPTDQWQSIELNAVSCDSATSCTAVGEYDATGVTRALAEHWNGTTWTIQETPEFKTDPGGSSEIHLQGVSCRNANYCMAVGRGGNRSIGDGTLAMRWNGSNWTIKPTPERAGSDPSAPGAQLEGVSCAAGGDCTAVGIPQLIERWDGSSWTLQNSAIGDDLLGVSCPSASSCAAVGSSGDYTRPSTLRATAEHWTGTSWEQDVVPSPYGADQLNSTSCNASGVCMAVGESSRGALAERYVPPAT